MIFLFTAKADYRVKAPFTFKATLRQVVVAPFDSYIKTVSVEAGDRVIAGKTILGRLDVSEPRLELAALKAERIGYQKKTLGPSATGKPQNPTLPWPRSTK